MTECDRIRAEAPGLAALRPDDPERIAAMTHASGCPGCAHAVAEGERLQSLLAAAAPEPLPAAVLGRAHAEIHEQLRREARRRLLGSVAAVCASVLVILGFARSRSPSMSDWSLSAVLWAAAVALAAAASTRPRLVIGVSVLVAVAAGTLSGGSGPLVPSLGLECVAIELASAALVVGAVWFAVRSGTTSPARTAIAAAAAAGALAGDAALQVTCAAHTSVPHLLAFHVGGVLLAAAGASLLRRWPDPLAA